MAEDFMKNGYELVDKHEMADICIVNTCTVTNMSDRKSRQMLRRVKEINPKAIVVACGCYVQVAKQELEKMEEIDLVLGNNEKKDIVKYVEKYIEENNKIEEVQDVMKTDEFVDFGNVTFTEKTRAVIKVQDGCNKYCTYCIIPYARGKIRSRKPESVVSEIEEIAKQGIKEVVITGIHVASYGKDLNDDIGLIDLLEKINKIEGIERIRLGSLEPTLITKEFLNRLIKLEKICHHFHLSLQSGCDETLKRMNRKYTTEDFRQIVKMLRDTYTDVILTTDIIVGFPGETDEEFNKTYKYLSDVNFYKMHVFKYSPRRGTPASKMPNQIDGNIKEQRSKKLIDLSNNNELDYHKKYIGKTVEVLFEEEKTGLYKGHTQNYILVYCKSNENLSNKIVKVNCENIENEYIIAKKTN
ncbi:MAG: tRNA (N(6)-L-threonylcarbamoyladenosine(37)-C(2))-methylthiotransferase MtaB [Clostridia bacterium]|nr:tRNA (N(6)-L-threonylcarbamoyladenosine(37)-C(2))-methylthiotransferase MtaB [Clostridia bacterium]